MLLPGSPAHFSHRNSFTPPSLVVQCSSPLTATLAISFIVHPLRFRTCVFRRAILSENFRRASMRKRNPVMVLGNLWAAAMSARLSGYVAMTGATMFASPKMLSPVRALCARRRGDAPHYGGDVGECAAMADAPDPRHQSISGRQRVGHRQPRRARPGLATHRPAGDHRGAAGRRRQRRLRRGRQGCARRLHAGDELLLDGHRTRVAPEAALRSGARFHSGGADRHLAEHSGRFQTKRLQDGGRSRRRRQGQARHADLCLGRHRLLLAHGGRSDSGSPPTSMCATCRSAKAGCSK